jgi:AraC family transcriptional regulator
MQPEIRFIAEKKLAGMYITMTLAENRTPQLWQQFMPRHTEIVTAVTDELISMQVYDAAVAQAGYMTPQSVHQRWAAKEVTDFNAAPAGFETYVLPEGLYAVFTYCGTPQNAAPFFRKIFLEWLPSSEYVLDNRPHFEVLGPKYKHNDPESEEEVFIPVRLKQA